MSFNYARNFGCLAQHEAVSTAIRESGQENNVPRRRHSRLYRIPNAKRCRGACTRPEAQGELTQTEMRTPPIEFEIPWLHEQSPGPRPMALSDLGNSERFALGHSLDVRYVQQSHRWLVWDERRWAQDSVGTVKRFAKTTARNILLEAAVQDSDKHRNELIAHQIRSESERGLRAMLSVAESDEKIAARLEDFDRDPMLFNVQNGTLNLRTCELRPHLRDDLITKLAPVVFDPGAKAPTWDRFLDEIMDGDDDRIRFLQRATGYSLTGDVTEHTLFLLHGIGANGKSTFLETLRSLFGDYATQSDFGTFLVTKGNAIRNDIARLAGARLVCAVESDAGKRMAETVVKHITGGDTVAARYLYSEHFEFKPQFKLWLATNHRPRIVGTDEAVWRRVRLVPFTVTIPPEKRDRELQDKLRLEASGIFNWSLAGLRDWRANGLSEPPAVRDAVNEYRQHEDVIGHFIDAKLVADVDAEVSASDLYAVYQGWARNQGEYVMNERDFSDALISKKLEKGRNKRGRFWKNIKIVAV